MKLTIEHLKGYLGTELKIQNSLGDILELTGIMNETYFVKGNSRTPYGDIQDCKPLLYPLSTLTEFREDLGFVPIEQLAKMSCSLDFDDLNVRNDWNGRYGVFSVQFRRGSHFYEFKYDSKKQSFKAFTDTNHLQLFQKLYEWNIDIHGLIEQGLAIDKSKL